MSCQGTLKYVCKRNYLLVFLNQIKPITATATAAKAATGLMLCSVA